MIARKFNAPNALSLFITGAVVLGAAPVTSFPVASGQVITLQQDAGTSRRDGRIGESDIRSLVKTLKLDADQEALVRALYDGHRSAWDEAAREHRESIQAMFQGDQGHNNPDDVAKKVQAIQKQLQAKRDQLESEFFDSVKGIVSDDQRAGWPRFERDRRRHKLQAKQSSLGGEGVDLIDVSESIDLPDEALASLEPVSNLYAEEMDLAITDRARSFEVVQKAIAPPENGDFSSMDFESVQKAQEKLREKHTAVRDVNERYAALFKGQLSADDAQHFMDLYLQRSFPSVYRPTAADRYIKQIRGLETLTDEQTQALNSINGDYQRQVGSINDQLVQVIREEEEKAADPGMFFGDSFSAGDDDGAIELSGAPIDVATNASEEGNKVSFGFVIATKAEPATEPPQGGGQSREALAPPGLISLPGVEQKDDSPKGKLNKSKSDLVDRTIDAVAALLTPEQLAVAPKPDELERLAPEERMRRMIQQALQNAVITTSDGNQEITFTVDPATGGK